MLELVHLHASQINGCGVWHSRMAKKLGETDEPRFAVAAWREAPCFTNAAHGARACGGAATQLSDRADPVPDEIWNEVGSGQGPRVAWRFEAISARQLCRIDLKRIL